jgi:hypothetical protein
MGACADGASGAGADGSGVGNDGWWCEESETAALWRFVDDGDDTKDDEVRDDGAAEARTRLAIISSDKSCGAVEASSSKSDDEDEDSNCDDARAALAVAGGMRR